MVQGTSDIVQGTLSMILETLSAQLRERLCLRCSGNNSRCAGGMPTPHKEDERHVDKVKGTFVLV
jgi:hypothetical protein